MAENGSLPVVRVQEKPQFVVPQLYLFHRQCVGFLGGGEGREGGGGGGEGRGVTPGLMQGAAKLPM